MPAPLYTDTATVTINPAFLQELKEDNRELNDLRHDLRVYCHRGIHPCHCCVVLDRLHGLYELLAMQFALEETFGYFEHPVGAAPEVSESAARLRDEHVELLVELKALIGRAESMYLLDRRVELAA